MDKKTLLQEIEDKKTLLKHCRPLPKAAIEQLEAWYDIELTYSSNALEGNTLTRSETAIVIEKGLTVRGKPLKDHQEAIDHFDALKFVHELVKEPRAITEMDVRDIHRLVLARTQSKDAGQYAKVKRRIAGSKVTLASPEKIPALMGDFGQWLSRSEPTPENAIEAHLRLVTIHPFTDGNGRTARLLMNLELMRAGYPPIIIHPENRPDYIDTLEKAQLSGDKLDYELFSLQQLNVSLVETLQFCSGGKSEA